MCGYFCNKFIHFVFRGENLIDYTNLFTPSECEKNENL